MTQSPPSFLMMWSGESSRLPIRAALSFLAPSLAARTPDGKKPPSGNWVMSNELGNKMGNNRSGMGCCSSAGHQRDPLLPERRRDDEANACSRRFPAVWRGTSVTTARIPANAKQLAALVKEGEGPTLEFKRSMLVNPLIAGAFHTSHRTSRRTSDRASPSLLQDASKSHRDSRTARIEAPGDLYRELLATADRSGVVGADYPGQAAKPSAAL